MRSLNLDQLRTLIEVIELGSFSAAARRLNLTQPAVSQQIRELERRFDVRLIERMGKQAHATAPGRDLVEAAQRIFRDCDLAETAMRRFREGWIGRVHIGTTNTAMTYDLPPILRKLRMDHPGIDLLLTSMPTRESVEHIIENKIDLALVTLPVEKKKLRITPLRPHMLVAILPAGTRDVPDEITPDYVARQPLLLEHARGAVHALAMRWLSEKMPLPRAGTHLPSIEALKTGVEFEPWHVDRAGRGSRPALARHHRASAAAAGPVHARAHRAPQQAERARPRDRAQRAARAAGRGRSRTRTAATCPANAAGIAPVTMN